ncbi:MAG: glycosyltransferase [Oleibacter sp.]|nr:glycosyltransferase [Thalassolituus sp.]
MIYVTVGTQLPFDRLIRAVDEWCAVSGADVFAQVGPSDGNFSALKSESFITPEKADALMKEADLVVAHAGMGTIITATQCGKPLIIMAREFKYGEHRNDHQVATAKRFEDFPNITVVADEAELKQALDAFDTSASSPFAAGTKYAPDEFINNLKLLIADS